MILASEVSYLTARRLINRNVVAGNGRTSMRLEPEFWDALLEICHCENTDLHGLIWHIDAMCDEGGCTGVVFLLKYFRTAATEVGYIADGHGAYVEQRAAA